MPSPTLDGNYTIADVLRFTEASKFKTRFDNAKRDHVTMIKIKSIQYYAKDRPKLPTVKYEIISRSVPQYRPYASGAKDKYGRKRYRQHSTVHQYDCVFQFGHEGINLYTKMWTACVGSMKRVPKKVPQDPVGQIHRETSKKWKKKYSAEDYKKKVKQHKRRAKYLSDGDYISQVYGINQDWIFRQAYAYHVAGHLYGRNYFGNIPAVKTNPTNIVFFGKHQIAIIKALLASGYLKK